MSTNTSTSPPTRSAKNRATRPRDAAASKAALLSAAQELFGKQGFDRTTLREIGERAGVDASLVARYFGSKGDLYIAAVVAEQLGTEEVLRYDHLHERYDGVESIADVLLTRTGHDGPGPVMQALIRSDTSAEILAAARDRLGARMVRPLAAAMDDQGSDRAQLRAEIAVAALLGVSLARTLSWFGELAAASKEDLIALTTDALGDFASVRPRDGDTDASTEMPAEHSGRTRRK